MPALKVSESIHPLVQLKHALRRKTQHATEPPPCFLKHQHTTAKLILVLPPTSRMLTLNGPLKKSRQGAAGHV